MQAAAEGKTIESKELNDSGGYFEVPQPAWNWTQTDYRVKDDLANADIGKLLGRKLYAKNTPVSKVALWCIKEFRPALAVDDAGRPHASLSVLLMMAAVGLGVSSFFSFIEVEINNRS